MKLKEFGDELLQSSKYSLKRFPITLIISFILFVLLVVLNEGVIDNRDLMIRICLITGLALPVSILIQLINETYLKKKSFRIISWLMGGIFLLLYYLVYLRNLNTIAYTRYIGMVLLFILGSAYIQKLRNKDNFEKYIISILNAIFITGIYSVVLYLGLVFIVFTLGQLFNLNIIDYIYYYVFLAIIFIFGVSMFLSKYPRKDFTDSIYPKAFKMLLLYILIPLVSIYTIILLAYFTKILVTQEWPSGLVSHLVIWYSTVSVFLIFFILPILEENKLALNFKRYFPLANIPILLMMFVSIGQRINQYGFTENRYYILLLGIWILLIMIHFITKRPKHSSFILISLSAFILISVLGPLSSFNVSIRSQNNRLNELLKKNNILLSGDIVPNRGVLDEEQRDISNILAYFNDKHSLDNIEILPEGYNLNSMKEDFGFAFTPDYSIESDSFYYENEWTDAIDLNGYDFYIPVNSWIDKGFTVAELDIEYNIRDHRLTISNEGEETRLDIKAYVRSVLDQIEHNQQVNSETMAVVVEADYNIKLIFNRIGGNQVSNGDDIELYEVDFILLLEYNK